MTTITRKSYSNDEITIHYEVGRCIHAAECVSRLPAVFQPKMRPWILPDGGTAEAIAQTIEQCPTGALQYERHDGGPAEAPAATNLIVITPNGPLYVRGDIRLSESTETRVALCRCGASGNKPYCDNSHVDAQFTDAGAVTDNTAETTPTDTPATLQITPATNGPLLLQGQFEIQSGDGDTIFRGHKAALCRCGGSANKPFCDGTHKHNGFRSEA
jgi:CDGSH-type Zn-finger protein/uncharacterized Fe-S cluster protein YjdI